MTIRIFVDMHLIMRFLLLKCCFSSVFIKNKIDGNDMKLVKYLWIVKMCVNSENRNENVDDSTCTYIQDIKFMDMLFSANELNPNTFIPRILMHCKLFNWRFNLRPAWKPNFFNSSLPYIFCSFLLNSQFLVCNLRWTNQQVPWKRFIWFHYRTMFIQSVRGLLWSHSRYFIYILIFCLAKRKESHSIFTFFFRIVLHQSYVFVFFAGLPSFSLRFGYFTVFSILSGNQKSKKMSSIYIAQKNV